MKHVSIIYKTSAAATNTTTITTTITTTWLISCWRMSRHVEVYYRSQVLVTTFSWTWCWVLMFSKKHKDAFEHFEGYQCELL